VRSGRLAKELLAPSGFGSFSVTKTSSTDAEPRKNERQDERRQHELDEKRGALRDAVEESRAADKAAQTARDEVDRLRDALDSATARATHADERARLARRREKIARGEIDGAFGESGGPGAPRST
jgi:chromosome segregation ATPase